MRSEYCVRARDQGLGLGLCPWSPSLDDRVFSLSFQSLRLI
jgi:hypothetical protein